MEEESVALGRLFLEVLSQPDWPEKHEHELASFPDAFILLIPLAKSSCCSLIRATCWRVSLHEIHQNAREAKMRESSTGNYERAMQTTA